MTKKVVFALHEFADLLTLETLYNGISQRQDVEFYFEQSAKAVIDAGLPHLQDAKFSDIDSTTHLVVASYSDWSSVAARQGLTLQIDQMIPKNCKGITKKWGKQQLRKKFQMKDELPSIVVGFANEALTNDLQNIIDLALPSSEIFLVGGHHPFHNPNIRIPPKYNDNIRIINQFGVLPDLFAAADLSLYGSNLSYSDVLYHNFLEATAGGPLIVIPPLYKKFGFNELVNAGCILSGKSHREILSHVDKFLRNFSQEKRYDYFKNAGEKRKEHILSTQDKYFNIIGKQINYLLGLDEEPRSDLLSYGGFGKNNEVRRLMHPETQWRENDRIFDGFQPTEYIHSTPEKETK